MFETLDKWSRLVFLWCNWEPLLHTFLLKKSQDATYFAASDNFPPFLISFFSIRHGLSGRLIYCKTEPLATHLQSKSAQFHGEQHIRPCFPLILHASRRSEPCSTACFSHPNICHSLAVNWHTHGVGTVYDNMKMDLNRTCLLPVDSLVYSF